MFKRVAISLSLLFVVVVGLSVVAEPAPAYACVGGPNNSFLGIVPPWHAYLQCDDQGGVQNLDLQPNAVWSIGFALLRGILGIAGLLGAGGVIWGGMKYITSQGSPDATASARRTIISSLAGVVIATASSVLVVFLFNIFNGGAGLTQVASTNTGAAAVRNVFNVIYGIMGILSVMYIVIGAIKFATSTGDPGKAASARNTVIYAAVGLIVVIAASTITSEVITRVTA